jgi:hypothetical protein
LISAPWESKEFTLRIALCPLCSDCSSSGSPLQE